MTTVDLKTIQHRIGGAYTPGTSTRTAPVYDPATDSWTQGPNAEPPLKSTSSIDSREGECPAANPSTRERSSSLLPDPVAPTRTTTCEFLGPTPGGIFANRPVLSEKCRGTKRRP